jgi:hypothetical protein
MGIIKLVKPIKRRWMRRLGDTLIGHKPTKRSLEGTQACGGAGGWSRCFLILLRCFTLSRNWFQVQSG